MRVISQSDPAGEIAPLIDLIRERMAPTAIWLFGSRARESADARSDWDLFVIVADDAPDTLLDPVTAWDLTRQSGARATVVVARVGEAADAWGRPNTLGFDLARDGRRLDV